MVKNPPATLVGDARDMSLISESGISPGEGNCNSSNIHAWKNFMDRGTWWATVHGVTKSLT